MNKIAEKIIFDASAEAEKVLQEAVAKAERIMAEAKEVGDKLLQTAEAERQAYSDAAMAAARVNAELEIRKRRLSAEKKVLDEVYKDAEASILALKKTEYLKIIREMLSYADDGDEVMISEDDKQRITAAFIAKTAKELGIRLSLSDTYAPISGGVILKGNYADKNLSLTEDFRELRNETEPELWRALFGNSNKL